VLQSRCIKIVCKGNRTQCIMIVNTCSRSTSDASFMFLVWMRRISSRPVVSGIPMSTSRSKRPAQKPQMFKLSTTRTYWIQNWQQFSRQWLSNNSHKNTKLSYHNETLLSGSGNNKNQLIQVSWKLKLEVIKTVVTNDQPAEMDGMSRKKNHKLYLLHSNSLFPRNLD